MWSQYYQANVGQLLRNSILTLCSESVPYDDKLEIDGIICISAGDEGKQIVVKVHEVLESLHRQVWQVTRDDISPDRLREKLQDRQSARIGNVLHETNCFYQKDAEINPKYYLQSQQGRSYDANYSLGSGNLEEQDVKPKEQFTAACGSVVQTVGVVKQQNSVSRQESLGFSEVGKFSPKRKTCQAQLPCQDIFPGRRQVSWYRQQQQQQQQHTTDPKHQGEMLCKICGSRYSSFALLNIHNLDTHRRFTCRQCCNTFSLPCNLRRHERLHAGRKPYNCRFCGKGFSRNGDVRLHELRHRSGSTYQLRCSRCLKSYSKKKAFRLHKCIDLKDIVSRLSIRQAQKLQENVKSVSQKKEGGPCVDRSPGHTIEVTDFKGSNRNVDLIIKEEERNEMSPKCEGETNAEEPPVLREDTESTWKNSKRELEYKVSQLKKNQKAADCKSPSMQTDGRHQVEAEMTAFSAMPQGKEKFEKGGSLLKGLFDTSQAQNNFSSGRIVFPGQDSLSCIGTINTIITNGSEPALKEAQTFQRLPFSHYLGTRPLLTEDKSTGSSSTTREENQYVGSYTAEVPGRERSKSPYESSAEVKGEQLPESQSYISLNRRYWCRLCKSQWENFKTYEDHHIRQHLRYPCHFCNQTFSNKNNRSRHIRSHTGQKQHACPECGKCFSRSDTLKEHQIIHTDGYLGDKCNYCDVVIKKKAELLGHIKKCSQRYKHGGADGRSLRAEQPSILFT